jgi:manganese/zinc/iron transport system substrate-binding protein
MSRAIASIASVLGVSAILLAMGCSNGPNNHGAGPRPLEVKHRFDGVHPIKAVCTTGMVADLVRHIGKGHVAVDQLLSHGIDPHTYEATPGDTKRLSRADIIFYSGLHLEGKMADILGSLSGRRPAFGVAEFIEHKTILKDEEDQHDPHVWFDVSLWSQTAGVVRDILMQYDSAHADEYKKRADDYQADLAKLHEDVKQKISTIPKAQRVLVTSHDAFRYFGRAYDIEVKGIQGISTEDEASLKQINDLAEFLVARKIKAVFVETSVNPSNMKALIRECRARGHEVREGGTLFSDAMGRENTREGTYLGMIEHNVRTIVDALK